MKPAEVQAIRANAVRQGVETIRNRVDQFGVREPPIQQQGENRILVQLPGVQDPQRAKALIGKTALLEFKLVDEGASVEEALHRSPRGDEILYQRRGPQTGRSARVPYVVKKGRIDRGPDRPPRCFGSQRRGSPTSRSPSTRGAEIFDRVTDENVEARWRSSSTATSIPRP